MGLVIEKGKNVICPRCLDPYEWTVLQKLRLNVLIEKGKEKRRGGKKFRKVSAVSLQILKLYRLLGFKVSVIFLNSWIESVIDFF